MCLVLGRMVDAAISLTQPWLSSNTVECVVACCTSYPNVLLTSFSTVLSGMRSHSACDNEMYSAFMVESAISLCSFEVHNMGYVASMMM